MWPYTHFRGCKWGEHTNFFQTPVENYCGCYCISSTTFFFLWSLPPLFCLFVCLPLFSLACVSIFHRPATPPPMPFEPFFWMERLRGGREGGRGKKKKWSAVVGICVSWPNRLHMLVVMAQDVADLIYSLLIFLKPPSWSPSVTIFRCFRLWRPFLLFIMLYFLLPCPSVTTGKLDFSNVLQRLAPVLNSKCVLLWGSAVT